MINLNSSYFQIKIKKQVISETNKQMFTTKCNQLIYIDTAD